VKNILVAYATWAGSTREIAEEIANILQENSFQVNIQSAKNITNINEYDAVILGTSIHAGQTVGSFRKFLKKNLKDLLGKPTALFVVCANMMDDTENNRTETMAWLKKAIVKYEGFHPISVGLFGGSILTKGEYFNKLNFLLQKLLIVMDKKFVEKYGKSDFRDHKLIRSWTESLINNI